MPKIQSFDPQLDRRCAIYTRKSTTLGLEREFNSLEGQRAICSAYITSQRHKRWKELAKHYDDGGYSGASLNRPMLQELLADIERGQVDVVVVYKLDRMTRTLLDFVRLVDFLEKYDVVFVSITQNFDTADTMGRLILNVLLTFAQFEREMASDRIRDKIRMTKQSGRWAGGTAPLGYDLMRHRLHVNEEEAMIVRRIFARYIELKNLTAVHAELRKKGFIGKTFRTRSGRLMGGNPITKSLVRHVLENPVYLGRIRHRDESYPGLHAPIVDQRSWDKVRVIRAEQAHKKEGRNKANILTDLLFDSFGRRMGVHNCPASQSRRKASRFYMSNQTAWGERQQIKRLRAKADPVEQLVINAVAAFLSDRGEVRSMLLRSSTEEQRLEKISRQCQRVSRRLMQTPWDRLRLVLRALISRIELSLERVIIVLRCNEIERYLAWDGVGLFKGQLDNWKRSKTHLLDLPADAIRTSRCLALPIEPRTSMPRPHPSPSLKQLIRDARTCQSMVDKERDKSLKDLANQLGYSSNRFARVLRLNYLAPDIILSIIDGTHPPGLTRTKLVEASLPMDWALQRKLLGFPERPQPEGAE